MGLQRCSVRLARNDGKGLTLARARSMHVPLALRATLGTPCVAAAVVNGSLPLSSQQLAARPAAVRQKDDPSRYPGNRMAAGKRSVHIARM